MPLAGSSRSATAHVAPKIGDSSTMTKCTGTLLWMAPEVFKGDLHYTSSVDVYSYGLIMWELATRKTPWDELVAEDFIEM